MKGLESQNLGDKLWSLRMVMIADIKYNGVDYPIRYELSKGYIHAYVTINGKRIVAADTERYLVFLNLQNHVYQELDLDK